MRDQGEVDRGVWVLVSVLPTNQMILSFTGTQVGINAWQREQVRKALEFYNPVAVSHGACFGADDEFDIESAARGIHRIIYPSNLRGKSQWPERLRARGSCEIKHELPPLTRNPLIVNESTLLIACPRTNYEVLRSGTWATVRYARKKSIPIILIYPTA